MKSREGNQNRNRGNSKRKIETKRRIREDKCNCEQVFVKKAAAPANAGSNLKDKLDKSQLSHKTCQRQAAFFRNEKGA